MHMATHMESLCSVTLTHCSSLRSQISVAFHLAHYQNSMLSVVVSRPHTRVIPTNYPIHCLSREKRVNSLQISPLSRTRAAAEDRGVDSSMSKIVQDISGV